MARDRKVRLTRWDVVAAIAAAGSTPVVAAVGLAHLPVAVISALSLLIAGATVAVALAINGPRASRVPSLWTSWAVLVLLLVSIVIYHAVDRGNGPHPHALVVTGSETEILRPVAEPRGDPRVMVDPLYGNNAYWFDCARTIHTESGPEEWVRLAGRQAWVLRSVLHAPRGSREPHLPPC